MRRYPRTTILPADEGATILSCLREVHFLALELAPRHHRRTTVIVHLGPGA
jgi:hypothetical protein